MSQIKPISPRGADAAVVSDVRRIIADSRRHLYSVSLIYRVHNAVFGLSERPQTCGSCLQRRVRALKGWLAEYEAAAAPAPAKRKHRKKVAEPEPAAEPKAAEPDSAPAADPVEAEPAAPAEPKAAEPDSAPAADPVEAEPAAPADPEPADATTAEPSEGAER